jgi:hypothetical protein
LSVLILLLGWASKHGTARGNAMIVGVVSDSTKAAVAGARNTY